MKIVHYMARMRLEDGGVVRAVLDLCGALAERGHDVRVLTFDATDVPAEWTGNGRSAEPRVTSLRDLRRAASEARPFIAAADIVHLHVPWDPVCYLLSRTARRAGVPYVVGIHGMLDDWSMDQKGLKKRLYLSLLGRRFLEQAGAVQLTAEAEREQSSKWYPRGRPVVLPLIFDLTDYEALPGPGLAREKFASSLPQPGVPVVLFLSRLHPKKRVEALIEAAALLRDDGVAFRVLIAGTGEPEYEQSLRDLVTRLRLGDHAVFVGFVSGREKVSLYEAADVSVLPTSQENWGFALIESLACGTPVITTRGVDIWSELESSGGAVIVEQDPAAIAAALTGLFASRDADMGARGRTWVIENLNTTHVIGQYERLYEDLRDATMADQPCVS